MIESLPNKKLVRQVLYFRMVQGVELWAML